MEESFELPDVFAVNAYLEDRARRAASDIRRAFGDMPKPAPDNIGYPVVEGYDDEASVAQRFFAGKDWQDMTYEVIRDGLRTPESAALGWMTPVAFRYFLPAYMIIALEEYEDSDATAESAVSKLIPDLIEGTGNADQPGSRFAERFEDLDERQMRAIAGFLLAMQELHGQDFIQYASPMAALELYWARFLPERDRALVGRVKGKDITRDDVERVRAGYMAKAGRGVVH